MMELLESMYEVVNTSTIIMQAKMVVDIPVKQVDLGNGITLYNAVGQTTGVQTMYAILFKTETENYCIIAPDFLPVDAEYTPCGKWDDTDLVFTICGYDEEQAITQFKTLVGQ